MIGRFVVAVAAGLLAWAGLTPRPDALNDACIAHIAYTAGVIDVAAGRQALARSRNEAVRSFADEMIRDHTAVNNQALALVNRLGVAPVDNPVSIELTKAANDELARLSSLNGAAFDHAYVRNEIAFHRTVNQTLQRTLIPGAQNRELKALLEAGLRLFSEHQMHAEALATKLG